MVHGSIVITVTESPVGWVYGAGAAPTDERLAYIHEPLVAGPLGLVSRAVTAGARCPACLVPHSRVHQAARLLAEFGAAGLSANAQAHDPTT